MSKTMLAHDSLVYLTPAPGKCIDVVVLLLIVRLSLPCSSWLACDDLLHLVLAHSQQFLVELSLDSLACCVVLAVLVCLPFGAAVDEQLGFWLGKGFIWPLFAPMVDSKPGHFGDPPLACVCC
jgi:hypothetical protein